MTREERYKCAFNKLSKFRQDCYIHSLFGGPIPEECCLIFDFGEKVENVIRRHASVLAEEYAEKETYTGGYDPYLDYDIDPEELYNEVSLTHILREET